MKKSISIFIILFLVSSFILLLPDFSTNLVQKRSNQLIEIINKNGNVERIDYVDENGVLAIAADLGYATKITSTEDFVRIEHFYDDKGNPVSRYPGFFAILREYDKDGRNYHIQYLDDEDKPTITADGYSDKYIVFDGDKIKTEKYFSPDGNPICTSTYGYGLLNEYDENGNKVKITYLDENDEPMQVGLGYAIVTRNIYKTEGPENGKVEYEFYYDASGKPIALSLGQYGVHKEYDENGLESIITYLDDKGTPIITNKGYTTLAKTYHANNYIATERYYDIEGKPISLNEGQYGIKKENGQILYLDQKGEESFNLKRLLYNHSWIIIPCVIVISIISSLVGKKWNILLFIMYIMVIAYMTLMYRRDYGTKIIHMLDYFRCFFTNREARADMLRNIWLFIPLGLILYHICPKIILLLVPIMLSICIEGIQYITETGFCELGDVVSNGIGGGIGIFVAKLTKDVKWRINSWEHIHILQRR